MVQKIGSTICFFILVVSFSHLILADSVTRTFNYATPICMNQSIEVSYARVSENNSYWSFEEFMPEGWSVVERNLNQFNQLKFFPGGTQSAPSISSITFHFITPSVPGIYILTGTYWNYGDGSNTHPFLEEVINVTNCVGSHFNCLDEDLDGSLDYDAETCPIGRDRCKQTNFNFSNIPPELQNSNLSYPALGNLFNLTIIKGGVELKFTNMKSFGLDDQGCFVALNLTPYIELEDNKAIIRSENLSQLNNSLEIVFRNISFAHPIIKKDGADCSNCNNIFFNSSTSEFRFGLTSFVVYPALQQLEKAGFFRNFFLNIASFFRNIGLTGKSIFNRPSSSITGDVVYEIVEQCSDGVMNYDETGVDCGGSCSACGDSGDSGDDGGSGGGGGGGNTNPQPNLTQNNTNPLFNEPDNPQENTFNDSSADDLSDENGYFSNLSQKASAFFIGIMFGLILIIIAVILMIVHIIRKKNYNANVENKDYVIKVK